MKFAVGLAVAVMTMKSLLLERRRATGLRVLVLLRLFLFLCLLSASAQCAQIVFIDQADVPATARMQAELAARFYGLQFTTVMVDDGDLRIERSLREQDTSAVMISSAALPFLSKARVFSALSRSSHESVPLMIVGVTENTAADLLKTWSTDTVFGCRGISSVSLTESLAIADNRSIARELAGRTLPLPGGVACGLILSEEHKSETIAEIKDRELGQPVFVEATSGNQNVFFEAALGDFTLPQEVKSAKLLTLFPPIAPVFMFVRYSAGARGWHRTAHYANLTIDDAWLTEPYGNLNFQALLAEMQRANFHTTIAFIPWNFDRSTPDVVALVRSHPERFSISVHGNNHNHQEFYAYTAKPLSGQIDDIKQAIARMERFKALTGIPYDRVMVWPHEQVPPADTLAALKAYDFLANVDAQIIPLDEKALADPLFPWHSDTLDSANFLTIKRLPLPASLLESRIAINAFLGNPNLFYVHQEFFAGGSSAFNDIATLVNQIAPDVQWESLGNIAKNLSRVRKRDDGQYDVEVYSSQAQVENSEPHAVTFYVAKEESFSPPVKSLIVNGRPHSYERLGSGLFFKVTVGAKESVQIVMAYENDLNVPSIDIEKSSFRVNAIRRLSDFRDMWVSRSGMGRAFVRFYTNHLISAESAVEEHFKLIVAVFLAGFVCLTFEVSRRLTRARKRPRSTPIAQIVSRTAVRSSSQPLRNQ